MLKRINKAIMFPCVLCIMLFCAVGAGCTPHANGLYAYDGPSAKEAAPQYYSFLYLSSPNATIKQGETIDFQISWGSGTRDLQKIEICVQADVFSYSMDSQEVIEFDQGDYRIEDYTVPLIPIEKVTSEKMPFQFCISLTAQEEMIDGQSGDLEIAVTEYTNGLYCKRSINVRYRVEGDTIVFSIP